MFGNGGAEGGEFRLCGARREAPLLPPSLRGGAGKRARVRCEGGVGVGLLLRVARGLVRNPPRPLPFGRERMFGNDGAEGGE